MKFKCLIGLAPYHLSDRFKRSAQVHLKAQGQLEKIRSIWSMQGPRPRQALR